MDLSTSTWTDADALDTDLALLPVGSTEQHGPHAPLGTDTIAAQAVATAGAERYDGEIIVAPAIPVAIAEEHRHFTGTLWVSPDTFRQYVRETVASLAHHGFDRVVIVNGHGGNVDALREVCGTISRHDRAYSVSFTWFDAIARGGMATAGRSKPTSFAISIQTSSTRNVSKKPEKTQRIGGASGNQEPTSRTIRRSSRTTASSATSLKVMRRSVRNC